jgi:hypothetical protein
MITPQEGKIKLRMYQIWDAFTDESDNFEEKAIVAILNQSFVNRVVQKGGAGMRRLLIVLLSAFLFSGCFSAPVHENDLCAVHGKPGCCKFDVVIVGAAFGMTQDRKVTAIVEFDWKNNSDEETSFTLAVRTRAYQNKVECLTAEIEPSDSYDFKAYMKRIKSGEKLKVWQSYVLQDDSPVTVEVASLSIGDSQPVITRVLELK